MSETILDVMHEYVDSCLRTGHDDHEENVRVFLAENSHIVGLTRVDVELMYAEEIRDREAFSRRQARNARKLWTALSPEERSIEMSKRRKKGLQK